MTIADGNERMGGQPWRGWMVQGRAAMARRGGVVAAPRWDAQSRHAAGARRTAGWGGCALQEHTVQIRMERLKAAEKEGD
jgi:hypothetical protein